MDVWQVDVALPILNILPYVYTPLQMLRERVAQGKKDVFYCDDSHWPPKTAKLEGVAMAEKVKTISDKTETDD